MKNVKEIIYGNDSVSLKFISKSNSASLSYMQGNFSIIDAGLKIGNEVTGDYTSLESDGAITSFGEAMRWDEITNPILGQNVLTSPGRVDYNYDNLTIDFSNTSRYPEEFVGVVSQFPHRRSLNTPIRPHVHWIQTSDVMPNILIEYRTCNNGDVFSDWTLKALTVSDNLFDYASTNQQQITEFNLPDSLGDTLNISGTFECKIYRDSQNASGLFSDVDLYTGDLSLKYYDIHFLVDTFGSTGEFIK